MIKPNLPKLTEGRKLTQLGFMRLLWKIVANQGGRVVIKSNELQNLPVNAALKADYDAFSDTFAITSIVRQPDGILTPDTGIITS
jgi:hypothetical protein